MDLDELFGQGRDRQGQKYGQRYRHGDHDDYEKHNYRQRQRYDEHEDDERDGYVRQHGDNDQISQPYQQIFESKRQMLNNLVKNPKMRWILIFAVVITVLLLILVIMLCLPLLLKLLNYFSQNGIQGIIDTIWKGTKN